MNGIGKQIGEGIKDVAAAVSVDAAKGVGDVAKNTVVGGIESLTGASISGSQNQQQSGEEQGQSSGASQQQLQEKARRKQAEAAKIRELQQRLEQVARESKAKEQEKVQVAVAEQQQKQEEKAESGQRRRLRDLLTGASQRGGTGEIKKGSF